MTPIRCKETVYKDCVFMDDSDFLKEDESVDHNK